MGNGLGLGKRKRERERDDRDAKFGDFVGDFVLGC